MAATSKAEWRARLDRARRERTDAERATARSALAAVVLSRVGETGWRTVAAYEALRTEPGSEQLLTGLRAADVRVLVPITLADRDLDWREWPDGPALGRDTIATADAVLAPASAAALDGTRLGRGGGSYDRALRRARPTATRVALLFDGELVEALPRDDWDEPVDAVAQPSGWTDLDVPPRG